MSKDLNKTVLYTAFDTDLKCPYCGGTLCISVEEGENLKCVDCKKLVTLNEVTLDKFGGFNININPFKHMRKTPTVEKMFEFIKKISNIETTLGIGGYSFNTKTRHLELYIREAASLSSIAGTLSEILNPMLTISELEHKRKTGMCELYAKVETAIKNEPIEYDSELEARLYEVLKEVSALLSKYCSQEGN